MPDSITSEQRSEIMSHIHGKDTQIELLVRKWLFSNGVRYRLHSRKVLGRPDISIRKYKIAIFINGCFWHGHEGCKFYRLPKSNVEFWENKLKNNIVRDRFNVSRLNDDGWLVITLWECELKRDHESVLMDSLLLIRKRIAEFKL